MKGGDRRRGAFLAPLLLRCRDPHGARAVHEVEAFGPVATLLPYRDSADAIALARRGGGSLVASVFSADDAAASHLVLGLAPYHGRILVANARCARESTGHGSPLAPLVHGGPGRAGGGEEMGGIRGVLHYMQRTAVQGTPDTITALGGRWVRGSRQRDPGRHPFRLAFNELRLGDTLQFRRARGDRRGHRALRRAVRRHVLRAYERAARRRAIRCSAAASRTDIF